MEARFSCPPPCHNFTSQATCPPKRCSWTGSRCAKPPPPSPPPPPPTPTCYCPDGSACPDGTQKSCISPGGMCPPAPPQLLHQLPAALPSPVLPPMARPGYKLLGLGNCMPNTPNIYNYSCSFAECAAVCSHATLCTGVTRQQHSPPRFAVTLLLTPTIRSVLLLLEQAMTGRLSRPLPARAGPDSPLHRKACRLVSLWTQAATFAVTSLAQITTRTHTAGGS